MITIIPTLKLKLTLLKKYDIHFSYLLHRNNICVLQYRDRCFTAILNEIDTTQISDNFYKRYLFRMALNKLFKYLTENNIINLYNSNNIMAFNSKPCETNTSKTTKSKDIIDKLISLRDDNPNFASAIEQVFPEIIDNTPFVTAGTIYVRKDYPSNLYVVNYEADKMVFKIRNVVANRVGDKTKQPSNSKVALTEVPFLTRRDFLELVSFKLENIKIVTDQTIATLTESLFNSSNS